MIKGIIKKLRKLYLSEKKYVAKNLCVNKIYE